MPILRELTRPWAFAAVVLPLAPAVAAGQTTQNEPIKTTICELVETPEGYSQKIIEVRGHIEIGFENFMLPASECAGRKVDAVWLEYGKRPKRQPTTWCCGDMVPRDPLVLVQDDEFRRLHQYLTAKKRVTGCYDCYLTT
jgi:hypothetical protein